MMMGVVISKEWYDEIKTLIKTQDPYFFTETWPSGWVRNSVEVDVEEEEFRRVSKELGWMM